MLLGRNTQSATDTDRSQQRTMYTMIIQSNTNQQDKFIVAKKKPNCEIASDAAKVNSHKLCDCPRSEPGKINLDIFSHSSGCHIRKRL